MSTKHGLNGRKSFYSLIRSNAVAAKALPDPEGVWSCYDVPDELAEQIPRFAAHGVIKRVGYVTGNSNAREYRTNPAAYEVAKDLDPRTAHCGHTGVKNLGDGEFTCSNGDCDARFGREVAEEVVR